MLLVRIRAPSTTRAASRDVVVPRENGRRGGGLAPPCQNRAVTTHRERASTRAFCIRAVNVNIALRRCQSLVNDRPTTGRRGRRKKKKKRKENFARFCKGGLSSRWKKGGKSDSLIRRRDSNPRDVVFRGFAFVVTLERGVKRWRVSSEGEMVNL